MEYLAHFIVTHNRPRRGNFIFDMNSTIFLSSEDGFDVAMYFLIILFGKVFHRADWEDLDLENLDYESSCQIL